MEQIMTFTTIFDTVNKIVIPKIQRDFAYGRTDSQTANKRARFLGSIYSKISNGQPISLDFVYGDLRDGVLTPLDGQQRLTILFLLYWFASKKENIDLGFLKNFTYETRPSARDFCEKLVNFTPDLDNQIISEEIKDQNWFPLEWNNDPTIQSMLVVLDDIQKQFSGVMNLREKLENISFHFLAIEKMGLTDELYIKMNSRGKLLSDFEHFKAELEKQISIYNEEKSKTVIEKIDTCWTTLLWECSEKNKAVDSEFLSYFNFICNIIRFIDGKPRCNHLSVFEKIDEFFSDKSGQNPERNIQILEQYFDCWFEHDKPINVQAFFDNFITTQAHEPGKIKLNKSDVFRKCISGDISLGDTILLYAFIVYRQNMKQIQEKDFRRRIRIVNNLIQNSSDQISDSENRSLGNTLPAIIKQVENIIRDGKIKLDLPANFNSYQLSEEQEKLEWTHNNPEMAESLFTLEDHHLLYGQIAIIGLENSNLFGQFSRLFEKTNWDLIDCAMLSLGDYFQQENSWRIQIGSSNFDSAWKNLFHKSGSTGFDNTKSVLTELLGKISNESDVSKALEKIAEDFTAGCENKKEFPWKYYYVKYEAFRPGRYGKCIYTSEKPYELIVLWTERQQSANAYNPFIKALEKAIRNSISRESWGERIYSMDNNLYIDSDNTNYYIRNATDEDVQETVEILQNSDGIDKEDRIRKIQEKMKEVLLYDRSNSQR